MDAAATDDRDAVSGGERRDRDSLQVSTITAVGKAGGDIDIVRLFYGAPLAATEDEDDTAQEGGGATTLPTTTTPVVARAEMFRGGLHHVRWKQKGFERAYASRERIRARRWTPPDPDRLPPPSSSASAPAEHNSSGSSGNCCGASFGNQVTLVLRCARPAPDDRGGGGADGSSSCLYAKRRRGHELPPPYNCVNVKVFNNGGIQMTGVKTVEQGVQVLDFVVQLARESAPSLTPHGYRVCLINSDFRLGFQIRRDRLHALLVRRYPHLNATFDPCSYPGVVIRYKWKADRPPEVPEGACACNVSEEGAGGGSAPPLGSKRRCCNGKGDGHAAAGGGTCRSITVIMFASGNVIITGARSYEQLRAVHDFVRGIILHHRKTVERVAAPPPPPPPPLATEATTTTTTADASATAAVAIAPKKAERGRGGGGRREPPLSQKKQQRHGNKNLLSFLSKARVRTVSVEQLLPPPLSF